MSDRNLTTKDILQKEFKPALRGFNTADVDEFLDLIIRDYESYEKEITYLTSEVDRLKRVTSKPKDSSQSKQSSTKSTPDTGTTNYDILRRLSKLEKEVFGQHKQAATVSQETRTSLNRETNHQHTDFIDDDEVEDTVIYKK